MVVEEKHSVRSGVPQPDEDRERLGKEPEEWREEVILPAPWKEVGLVERAPGRNWTWKWGLLNHDEDTKGGAVRGDKAETPKTGLHRDPIWNTLQRRKPPCTGPGLPRPASPRPAQAEAPGAQTSSGLTLAAVFAAEAGSRAVTHRLVVHYGAHASVEAHPALALLASLARAPAAAVRRLVVQLHLAAVHRQGLRGVDPHVANPPFEGLSLPHGGQRELERRGAQFRWQPPDEEAAEHCHVPALGLDLHPLGLHLVDEERGVAELTSDTHAVPRAVVDRGVGQERGGLGAEDGEAELQAAAARQDELQEVAEALIVEVEH